MPTTTTETISAKKSVLPPGADDLDAISTMNDTKAYLQAQPKRTIHIRPEDGDQWAQINGYAFIIRAGDRVQVPEDVALLLEDAGII